MTAPCSRAWDHRDHRDHRDHPGRPDRVFAALASAVRREVRHCCVMVGRAPVRALAGGHFAVRRPSLSEHLRVLSEAGLVSGQRSDRQCINRLKTAPPAKV
ncbi:transcriptional regulator [Streptomyces sp. NPDC097941]|uniref:ArsR/SmtB family transcription factor n=1 Tax=Streptomyces sp. NPDC097941 TaxID=3155685 RepID=UPI003329A729